MDLLLNIHQASLLQHINSFTPLQCEQKPLMLLYSCILAGVKGLKIFALKGTKQDKPGVVMWFLAVLISSRICIVFVSPALVAYIHIAC